MIAIDLSKQQALDAYAKTIQPINFSGNMFFIIEEAKETILDFIRGTVRVILFCFNIISV